MIRKSDILNAIKNDVMNWIREAVRGGSSGGGGTTVIGAGHDAVTVDNSGNVTLDLTGQQLRASINTSSINVADFASGNPTIGYAPAGYILKADGFGGLVFAAPDDPAPTADTTPPTVPTNVVATATGQQTISLTWSPSSDVVGVTGYRIKRGGSVIGTSTTTSYNDSGLVGGTTYSYTVEAYDAAGNYSATSSAASATTFPAPYAPGWYVSPTGSSSNSGVDADHPWTLMHALGGAGGLIQPGDTVWMAGGTYPITGYTYVTLNGTEAAPILFKPLAGARATIEANGERYHTLKFQTSSWVYFYDIEVRKTGYSRSTPTTTASLEVHVAMDAASQRGIKFFACIMHDNKGMGQKQFESTLDGIEYNGCLLYFDGSDPQHDHAAYVHNIGTYVKLFKDTIFHNAASYLMHAYDDGARPVNNVKLLRCVFFNPTSLYSNIAKKQCVLIGGNSNLLDPTIEECLFYTESSSSSYQVRVGYGSSYTVTRPTIKGNYSVGRPWYFPTAGWEDAVVQDNELYAPGGWPSLTTTRINAGTNNTVAAVPTTGSKKFINAYDWDSKRANVVIYNFASAATITITNAELVAAGVDISNGDSYELHNSEDYYDDILTGTYDGVGIVIPMTGRTMAQPVGGIPKPASAFPKFGAFMMRVGGAAGGGGEPEPGEPVTVQSQPADFADDARYDQAGTFNAESSTLIFGKYDNTYSYGAFVRFALNIPQGKTINSAEIKFRVKSTRSGKVPSWLIDADKSSVDPAAPTSKATADARARTTATVTHAPGTITLTAGTDYTITGLGPILQEIVNQASWQANNHVILYFRDSGASGLGSDLQGATHEDGSNPWPTLTAEYVP